MNDPSSVSCANCGRAPRSDEQVGAGDLPWTWSAAAASTQTAGESDVLCDTCTREHARSIEAKLDPDWW